MATITVTRSFTYQGLAQDVYLISAFQRNTMTFDVERGSSTGNYATVEIGGYEFRAVKTATVGTTDSYIFDGTSVLSNLMGNAPTSIITGTALIKSYTITITAYEIDNTVVISDDEETISICFAYNDIGAVKGLNDIVNKGSSRNIYHNGKIGFYNYTYIGVQNLIISGVSKSYTLSLNYNNVTLDVAQLLNGTLTSSVNTYLSIPLYYKPAYGDQEIAWLNRDGGWSFWNFRKVSEEIVVKKSNEVATYYPTNAATISKSRMISAEKTVKHAFDTLAYDPTHFAQLCEIQESLAVIWNNKLVKVVSSNSLTAVCKQNLRFNLILEVDENIAGY